MIFHFLIEVDDDHDTPDGRGHAVRMQQIFPIMKDQVTFSTSDVWAALLAHYEHALTPEEKGHKE